MDEEGIVHSRCIEYSRWEVIEKAQKEVRAEGKKHFIVMGSLMTSMMFYSIKKMSSQLMLQAVKKWFGGMLLLKMNQRNFLIARRNENFYASSSDGNRLEVADGFDKMKGKEILKNNGR
ncbi:hypothetical protein Tco_0421727 [Tanacetum coccineum]